MDKGEDGREKPKFTKMLNNFGDIFKAPKHIIQK